MIWFTQALGAGNAVLVIISPRIGAVEYAITRSALVDIEGPDDPAAVLLGTDVVDSGEMTWVDSAGLENGTAYRYSAFYRTAPDGEWMPDGTADVTPAASYSEQSTDPQSFLIERLDAGLRVEVERGNLDPPANLDAIEVLRSPPVFEDSRLPVVTVEFSSSRPEHRLIGDQYESPVDLGPGWQEQAVGWIERVELQITAWSLNPDQRVALRRAVRRVVMANFPIFRAAGMEQIDISQQDQDDFASFGVPVYSALMTFSCIAPVAVSTGFIKIADVALVRNCDR